MVRPDIVGMRRSMVIKTTALHKLSILPPPSPLLPPPPVPTPLSPPAPPPTLSTLTVISPLTRRNRQPPPLPPQTTSRLPRRRIRRQSITQMVHINRSWNDKHTSCPASVIAPCLPPSSPNSKTLALFFSIPATIESPSGLKHTART